MKTTYQIDPAHSSAQFTVRHMMISNVHGGFKSVKGTVVFDPEDPTGGVVDAIIDATSINTMDDQRDGHLKSPDFLDVAQYPEITFKSTKVEADGEGEHTVHGDLTIHGVTKPVVLKVEGPTPEGKDPYGNVRIGASATTKISRADFGLTYNAALETGGILIGDTLKLELDVSLIKSV